MKKFINSIVIISLMLLCIINISCRKEPDYNSGSNSENNFNLNFLDIVNAKNLFISTDKLSNRAAENSDIKKLFKITEDGYIEEVKSFYTEFDENGNAIKKEFNYKNIPQSITKIDDDFLCISFSDFYTGNRANYIVRVSDGAVFNMEKAGRPLDPAEYPGDYINKDCFKKDNHNNLYYITYDTSSRRIAKINLSGLDSLESVFVSPSIDDINSFYVDSEGNILYEYLNSKGNYEYRLQKYDGSLKNYGSISAVWVGLDGHLYFNTYSSIFKIITDNYGELKSELYGGIDNAIYPYNSYKLCLKDKIIIVYDNIYEVYNKQGVPRTIRLDNLELTYSSVFTVQVSENYYYIAGQTKNNDTFLIRVDPETDHYINILPINSYEVYSFTVSETDGVTFNALRMKDGKKVLGKVGIDGGEIEILDEESAMQIICMERIN